MVYKDIHGLAPPDFSLANTMRSGEPKHGAIALTRMGTPAAHAAIVVASPVGLRVMQITGGGVAFTRIKDYEALNGNTSYFLRG